MKVPGDSVGRLPKKPAIKLDEQRGQKVRSETEGRRWERVAQPSPSPTIPKISATRRVEPVGLWCARGDTFGTPQARARSSAVVFADHLELACVQPDAATVRALVDLNAPRSMGAAGHLDVAAREALDEKLRAQELHLETDGTRHRLTNAGRGDAPNRPPVQSSVSRCGRGRKPSAEHSPHMH